tara:strand:+ start:2903 stop:3082 length:180 start_codon:yes stop_codon:yes gene_type:complete
MSSNAVDGMLEVLSDEELGINHLILVDQNGKHFKIVNVNIKETLEHKSSKLLFLNIEKV